MVPLAIPIKAICFDWDGTIVDTMSLKIKNAGELFHEFSGNKIDKNHFENSYKRYSGIPRKELFNAIVKDNIGKSLTDLEFNYLSNTFTQKNSSSFKTQKVFREDVRSLLAQLKKTLKLQLFVSSSAIVEEITSLAKHLQIEKYFTEILGSNPGFRKGKDHLLYISKKHSFSFQNILFVGDEIADIRLSGKLGVPNVGIAREKTKRTLSMEFADLVINDIVELKKVFSLV